MERTHAVRATARAERLAFAGALLIAGLAQGAAPQACPDANGDGIVDDLDRDLWMSEYCLFEPVPPDPPAPLDGDTFEDGAVNLFDIVPILACFGDTATVGTRGCAPAICEPLLASQFRVGAVGTDVCAGLNPISTLGGGMFYHHPLGSEIPPDPTQVCLFPELEFDSYVAAGNGPISCGSPPSSSMLAPFVLFDPFTLDGDWSPDTAGAPPVAFMESAPPPLPGLGTQSVFIARMTIPQGEQIISSPMRIFLQDQSGWHRVTALIDGPGVWVSDDGDTLVRSYGLRLSLATTVDLTSEGFGVADVHDLYIVSDPYGVYPDANDDGLVDDLDLGAVTGEYCLTEPAAPAPPLPPLDGDTNDDRVVNLFDAVPILACFGEPTTPGTRGFRATMCEPPLVGQFRIGAIGTEICVGLSAVSPLGGSDIYQHGAGGDTPPDPAQICLMPDLEFDSYVASGGEAVLCGSGPAPSVQVQGGFPLGAAFSTSALDADWFPDTSGAPPVAFMESIPAPVSNLGEQSVFIARVTVGRGEPIRNTPMRIALQDETGWHRITALINGPAVTMDDDGNALPRPYGVRLNLLVRTPLAGFGVGDVYDFYVVSNPIADPPMICPDLNLDGVVSFDDILMLRILLPTCTVNATLSDGDVYGDGVVNLFDLVPILACFQSPVPSGSGGCASGVCEPPLSAEFRLGTVGTDSCLGAFDLRTIAGGTIFQHSVGDDVPPLPSHPIFPSVQTTPELEFDSYVAAGHEPITSSSAPAPGVDTSFSGTGFSLNSLDLDWARAQAEGFTDSRLNPIPVGSQSIFVARITVQRGERLRRCPLRAYLQDALGWHRLTLLLNGPAARFSDDGVSMANTYAARAFLTTQVNLSSNGFGPADVYDIYLVANALSGDEDENGCISMDDIFMVLGNWLINYEPVGCSGAGDADGNGFVEFSDVLFVLGQWGETTVCPPAP